MIIKKRFYIFLNCIILFENFRLKGREGGSKEDIVRKIRDGRKYRFNFLVNGLFLFL